MRQYKIAVFGANGFVGSAICKALMIRGFEVFQVTRTNFLEAINKSYDYVVNAATPSARYRASQEPEWDFEQTVVKTARIYYGVKWGKFIQISSLSARCQLNTIYGRHKLAAENLVDVRQNLIFRLGPMYGPGLDKGVLVDMLKGSAVYVAAESRYCFCSVEFIGEWISENLSRSGIIEIGARNSISLASLAQQMGFVSEFHGAVDHQEIIISPGEKFPDVEDVMEYLKYRRRYCNDA